jgi:hypothetical protein
VAIILLQIKLDFEWARSVRALLVTMKLMNVHMSFGIPKCLGMLLVVRGMLMKILGMHMVFLDTYLDMKRTK